jgi:hypothetical protein
MLNPEDPTQLLNGRLDTNDVAGLGGVSISEPVYVCSYAGISKDTPSHIGHDTKDCNPVSYIIARNKETVVENVPFWEEPYVKFSKVAKDAAESGRFASNRKWDSDWNCLRSGSQMAISKWKQQYFVVGSVYNNGPSLNLEREHINYTSGNKTVDKELPRNGIPLGDLPDDPLVVSALSVSLGRKLLELLCTPKDKPGDGNFELNPSLLYKYGDPCGIYDGNSRTVDGGVFVNIFNPDKVKLGLDKTKPENSLQNAFNRQMATYTSFKGVMDKEVIPYEVSLTTMIPGPNGPMRPSLTTEQVDNITAKHLFLWRESQADPADSFLLYEPTIEERCVWIAKAFKYTPKLVELCWMSNPEYLAFDSVKAILRNRKQLAIPAMDDDDQVENDDVDAVDAVDAVDHTSEFVAVSKASGTKTKPGIVTVPEVVEVDFDGSTDSFDEDVSFDEEPVVANKPAVGKATAGKTTTSKPAASSSEAKSAVDDLVDSFDEEFGDEIEAESGDEEDQFEAEDNGFEESSSDVSADFDAVEESVEAEEPDNFEDQIQKSLSAAKAISRSKARSSKPKQ